MDATETDIRPPGRASPAVDRPSRRRFALGAGALLAVAGMAGCGGSRRQACYEEGRAGQKGRVLRAVDCPDAAD